MLIHTDTGQYRLRRSPGHRADHRRHPGLDHRGHPPLHRPAPDRPGRLQPQPPQRPDPVLDGAQHQRQGRGRNRRVRPVGAAARRAAVPDARRWRSGDHHRHHHQCRLHRQDGGRLGLGHRPRLRIARRSRSARTSAWISSGSRRSTPPSKAAPCCAWTPTRAGPPSRRSSPCARWKKPAWSWNCSNSRSRPTTSTASNTSPTGSTRR